MSRADPEALALADLDRSGITPEQAGAAGFLVSEDARDFHKNYEPVAALYIPYYDPWTGEQMTADNGEPFGRIRYLETPRNLRSNPFREKKFQRYAQPAGSGVRAYFPPMDVLSVLDPPSWEDIFSDKDEAIIITEGEKKALKAMSEGFTTIALGGVYNFYTQGVFLPELERIKWKRRDVYLCFDSDAARNPQVQAAEARLASELALKRGAILYLVRLPELRGGGKQALDDFLVRHGPDEFERMLRAAEPMRKIDTAVVSLNEHVAWIEREGMVLDLRTKQFIRKDHFTNGSVYSSLEIIQPKLIGQGVKRVSVTEEWLKHPHAQRYDTVLFDPSSNDTVLRTEHDGTAVNLWAGLHGAPGDVTPFLALDEFLFQNLDDYRDLPLKLLAYKAQNPATKIPLAFVLVGPQGGGKSLWAECVRAAFAPYEAEISDISLSGQFNGWVERTLWCVINDASAKVITENITRLRALISDRRVLHNEKYRKAQQIESYTQYIITSNERGVGSFSSDDRRMIVVDCPAKREPEFYRWVADWKNNGGGKALLHYLQNYDLKGWTPPVNAPMTREKYMAYLEGLSPIQRVAEEISTASEHIVVMWIDAALQWAAGAELSQNPNTQRQAREVIDSLQTIQIRPWYTPDECMLMFPSLVSQLHSGLPRKIFTAGDLSRELRTAGVRYLMSADDARGFRWRGQMRQYLILADVEEWGNTRLSQNEFERYMANFPRYIDLRMAREKKRKRVKQNA